MKVSNIDIFGTVADEKKFKWCLIQGWCFKKSSQYCPKKQKLRELMFERCQRLGRLAN